MRRVTLTLTVGLLLACISSGVASARSDLVDRVRFVAKPARVVQGGTVRVVVAVSPSGVRCNAILARGASVLARTAVARSGRATFAWKLARAARPGQWKITVLCGRAGSASTPLAVTRRTQPPAAVAARVVVDKSGFNFDDRFGTREVSYGVVLRNVSPDEDALRIEVSVNVLDSSNKILKTDSNTLQAIPASGTYYHAGTAFLSAGDPPARLEITARVQERQKKSVVLPPVSNLRAFDSFGSTRVAGEFSNPFTKSMSSIAMITIVVFDTAGAVIGGGWTFPSSEVPPGGRTGFETDVGQIPLSQIGSIQASVEPEVVS